jgi:23S rRNA (uracil1939-C5)-methyltransferase
MQIKTVLITSLAATGHGIADNGWHILGTFPGDIIKAQQYKFAEGISYAEIIEIISTSEYRTYTPTESPFFDSNAPWRYLKLEQENTEKLGLVKNIFRTQAYTELVSEINMRNSNDLIEFDQNQQLLETHYRNKASYAFVVDNKNKLSFALFVRGTSKKGKISQNENLLVHPIINKIGKQFLQFFNQKNIDSKILKYLILRYSYHTNSVVAQILVCETNRKKLPWKKSDLEKLRGQYTELQGIIVSHSEPNIRSAIITKDFYIVGTIEITEKVLDKEYIYHPSQFFQIYPKAFENILKDCEEIIKNIPYHDEYELLDLFAGIGIIGLHLSHLVHHVSGVEQSPLAGKYARKNALKNNIENFIFTEANVDDATEYIKQEQILVVDPTRSGLTKKLLEKIIEIQPKYIIYISCNPETQAKNYHELKTHYDITCSRAYNLFPKTPHIEHIIFLTKKTN